MTLKTVKGKHIVTYQGRRAAFEDIRDALEYIRMRKVVCRLDVVFWP